jgi:thiosulfate sulfurtransferase
MDISKQSSALTLTVGQLKKLLQDQPKLIVLDVRKAPAFEKNPVLIVGAQRVPPESVTSWAAANEFKDSTVIAYCVYGHEVSQGAAQTLRDLGVNAFFLEGGLVGWQESGGTVSVAG